MFLWRRWAWISICGNEGKEGWREGRRVGCKNPCVVSKHQAHWVRTYLSSQLVLDRRPKELPLLQDLDGDDKLRALLTGEIDSTKLAAAQLPANVKVVQRPHTVRIGGFKRGRGGGRGLLEVAIAAAATAAAARGAGGGGVHRHVFWWGEGSGWGGRVGVRKGRGGDRSKEHPAPLLPIFPFKYASIHIDTTCAHTFVFDLHFA